MVVERPCGENNEETFFKNQEKNLSEIQKKINYNMKIIPKGLANLGNTCFFNSVMQCLMNTHPLLLYFDHLKNLKMFENYYQYTTKVGEKSVQVPIAKFPLPEVSMPLVTTFTAFVQDYFNNSSPLPHSLFNQVCRKAPRFRGFAQQDAHELLRYLLDGLRQEEIIRFKKAFVQHVDELEDRKETNDKLVLRYKAYVEGSARPILDAVFGGVLQQSVKCLNCGHISIRYEPFLDLSLSMFRPKVAKTTTIDYDDMPKAMRKKEQKRLEKLAAEEEKQNENGAQRQNSVKSKHLKKKEKKNKKKQKKQNIKARNKKGSTCSNVDETLTTEIDNNVISVSNGKEKDDVDCGNGVNSATNSDNENVEEEEVFDEEDEEEDNNNEDVHSTSRIAVNDDIVELMQLDNTDFDSSGFSIINSLYSFTMPEILSGSNSYVCENCCIDKKKKEDSSNSTKKRCVEASKRYLISKPPLILTLHLKRFEQVYNNGRMSAKKFRGFVEFGLTLDLAPFCRKSAKRIAYDQKEVLYSLYGIVCHSGDLGGGHYMAYVRARPQMESVVQSLFSKCLRFEPDSLSDIISEKCSGLLINNNCDIEKNENGNSLPNKPNGFNKRRSRVEAQEVLDVLAANSKWYCISDSHVHGVAESKVLGVEAYILFYERVY